MTCAGGMRGGRGLKAGQNLVRRTGSQRPRATDAQPQAGAEAEPRSKQGRVPPPIARELRHHRLVARDAEQGGGLRAGSRRPCCIGPSRPPGPQLAPPAPPPTWSPLGVFRVTLKAMTFMPERPARACEMRGSQAAVSHAHCRRSWAIGTCLARYCRWDTALARTCWGALANTAEGRATRAPHTIWACILLCVSVDG